ncbi:MAG: DUF6134 family protein [Pseudomonadota bacterium]
MRALLTSLLVTLSLSAANAIAQPTYAESERTWNFRVFLDEREIGYHRFATRDADEQGGQFLDSEARFDVKILFINAFKYRHRSEERWVDGCLQSIEAKTRTNGERNRVAGQADADGFRLRAVTANKKDGRDALDLDAQDARQVDSGCVSTFAYWDRAFVDRSQLLNPQTGEVVPVTISPMGQEMLDVSGVSTPVLRYRIETPDGEIQVCYTRAMGRWEWVRLETMIEGRQLRYEREGGEELPRMLAAATVDPLGGDQEGTR